MFWNAAGKRVFNVTIQGQTVLQNFDIWALAGQYAAVQRTFVVAVTNGMLNIGASASVDNAQFAAIQIVYKTGDLYLHPIATLRAMSWITMEQVVRWSPSLAMNPTPINPDTILRVGPGRKELKHWELRPILMFLFLSAGIQSS